MKTKNLTDFLKKVIEKKKPKTIDELLDSVKDDA